jgi:stage II sporulation protein D
VKRRSLLAAIPGFVTLGWESAARAQGAKLLRVRLFSQIPKLESLALMTPFTLAGTTVSAGIWQLHADQGQVILRGAGQPQRYGTSVVLQRARGIQGEGQSTRRYRGWVEIRATAENQLQLINWVGLEDYLLSVVPSEMHPDWPQAALQAQAIAARTNAFPHLMAPAQLDHPSTDPPRLQDSTADQFYGGVTYETAATTQAVRATRDQILTFNQKPIAALFHSTCAGHTSANQEIFAPPAQPYLQGVSCDWCRASPFYGPHTIQLARSDLQNSFGSSDLQILQQDPQGRPTQLQLGSQLMTGQEFWLRLGQSLGWGLLPSNRFRLDLEASDPDSYTLVYQGAGHGVGLCQWGCRGMAEAGYAVTEILQHYYSGLQNLTSLR